MAKTILIVEDNEDNADIFVEIIERCGYETILASDGRDGVEKAQSELPDLIIMDVQLPLMSGLEATRILKAGDTTKHIPIIAVTAFASEQDRAKILAEKVNGFIPKPINVKNFVSLIEEHIVK